MKADRVSRLFSCPPFPSAASASPPLHSFAAPSRSDSSPLQTDARPASPLAFALAPDDGPPSWIEFRTASFQFPSRSWSIPTAPSRRPLSSSAVSLQWKSFWYVTRGCAAGAQNVRDRASSPPLGSVAPPRPPVTASAAPSGAAAGPTTRGPRDAEEGAAPSFRTFWTYAARTLSVACCRSNCWCAATRRRSLVIWSDVTGGRSFADLGRPCCAAWGRRPAAVAPFAAGMALGGSMPGAVTTVVVAFFLLVLLSATTPGASGLPPFRPALPGGIGVISLLLSAVSTAAATGTGTGVVYGAGLELVPLPLLSSWCSPPPPAMPTSAASRSSSISPSISQNTLSSIASSSLYMMEFESYGPRSRSPMGPPLASFSGEPRLSS